MNDFRYSNRAKEIVEPQGCKVNLPLWSPEIGYLRFNVRT